MNIMSREKILEIRNILSKSLSLIDELLNFHIIISFSSL